MIQQQFRRRHSGEGGFTLIELLVVIAVLAVLAAVVIFNITGVQNKGKVAACSTDVKTVQTAYDAYLNDGNTAFTPSVAVTNAELLSLQTKNYIHSVPTSCTTFNIDAAGNITGS